MIEQNKQQPAAAQEAVALKVWCGPMPESNGKQNWTVVLYRKGDPLFKGPHDCVYVSEYPDRARYEADRLRFIIGERADEPDITAYDAELHSGYTAPAAQEAVAFRLLYKTHAGEWSTQGRPWADGKPDPKIVADAALPGSRWKIEYAYAAPVTAAPVDLDAHGLRALANCIADLDGLLLDVGPRSSFPVTAAPAGAIAAMALCANAEPQGTPEGWEEYWDATPAAPGIDLAGKSGLLRRARSLFDQDREYALERGDSHHAGQCTKDIASIDALIDASPKGALPTLPDDFSESKDWRAGNYGERVEWLMDTVRSQREHIDSLLDSPKGGSEARDAARYRWLRDPDNYPTWRWWSDVLCETYDGQSFDYAIDAAMQAQAGDAEVQP